MSQAVLAPIDITETLGIRMNLPVIAATHLYAGTLLALNSSGYVTYATDAAGLRVVGRCEYDADNTLGSVGGEISVDVKRGVFKYKNSTTYPVAQANVGQWVYVQDEQTVAISSTYFIKAGMCTGIDTDGGIFVDTRFVEVAPQTQLLAAAESVGATSSTSDHIAIAGLLATDVVLVTLAVQAASETVIKAVAAAGQINITLSAAPTQGTTKYNYAVFRQF